MPLTPGLKIVRAIDISNHQTEYIDNILDQLNPDHVIVRLSQRVEPKDLIRITKAQAQAVLAHGKTLGVYGWLYKDVNIQQQCQDWLAIIQELGVSIPVLWIDIEPYGTNDNLPSIEQIEEAVNVIHGFGLNPGIYTGPWVWSLLRNRVSLLLQSCPLWTAEYNHLDTLIDVNLYGGWTSAVGHQYDDKPLDMDIFDYAYTVAA